MDVLGGPAPPGFGRMQGGQGPQERSVLDVREHPRAEAQRRRRSESWRRSDIGEEMCYLMNCGMQAAGVPKGPDGVEVTHEMECSPFFGQST